LAHLSPSRRSQIFTEATSIIGLCRAYSISATLRHADYNKSFSGGTRRHHSPYELCFLIAALQVGKLSEVNGYTSQVQLVVDQGNAYAEQVRLAHAEMRRAIVKVYPCNTGSLIFANDEMVPSLQAADIICWGARRKASKMRFLEGTDPIQALLDHPQHFEAEFPAGDMAQLESHFDSLRQ
jgi:hypothetical protein